MLIAVGTPLPDYRVKASASAIVKDNLIHDDDFARKCGYRGALVPGASIYAYITRTLVEAFGQGWLQRGTGEVRFVHPVYEGEEVRVSGSVSSMTREGILRIECQAMNPQGVVCAVDTAMLPPQAESSPPKLSNYPAGKNNPGRTITLQSLGLGETLNPVRSEFTRKTHWAYCQKTIRDHHPLFQEFLHPGWLLSQASLILAANYDLPAWIHVASVVQNFCAQHEECFVETRGRVEDKFERKGNHYLVLDLALFAGETCLQTILHTVIFRIAPRAA
jgi:hypothetical protein